MTRKSLTLVVLLVLLASPQAAAGPAANEASYSDPTGDSGLAPDIGAITVRNDDSGLLTFKVAVLNRSTLAAGDEIGVVFDADRDSTTGNPRGWDHVLGADAHGPFLLAWDEREEGFEPVEPRPAISYAWSPDVGFEIGIARAHLFGTVGFRFYALTFTDENDDDVDVVPDGDEVWTYSLALPFALELVPPRDELDTATAGAPRAGRAFTAGARVHRTDTGATITSGTVRCTATVAGKRLPASKGRFFRIIVGGASDRTQALCTWAIPKNARGKTFVGTVAVTFNGATVTKTFKARIR